MSTSSNSTDGPDAPSLSPLDSVDSSQTVQSFQSIADFPRLEKTDPTFAKPDDGVEPIAIVGFACNFPGDASSPEAFWEVISNARSVLSTVPQDRWNADGFYRNRPVRPGVHDVRKAHFVTRELDAFDAPFFKITAPEARCMDPQQRMLLETSFHAFENAGITIEEASGSRTCCYMASFAEDYNALLSYDSETRAKFRATSTGNAMFSNRLSWFFNLKGPSMTLDTACSGSLCALHLACQSIRTGETDQGLIGGCNLIMNPEMMTIMSEIGFLSPDGRSYTFDERANGYSRGEGAGVIIVKRLSHALRDGNTIRAIVRATGSNSDGRTPGITQPSAEAQTALIRETYKAANLSMQETRLLEAHGTGTPTGDPLEVRAIAAAFSGAISKENPLHIVASKPNIGHLENASGVASIIKTVLALEKGVIPPVAGLERVNPLISLEDSAINFPREAIPWPGNGIRRASVNSFGYGGSNGHAILDDAYSFLRSRGLQGKCCQATNLKLSEAHAPSPFPDQQPRLLMLSASDEDGIRRIGYALKNFMLSQTAFLDSQFLANLSFTLNQKRSRLPWKSYWMLPSSMNDVFDIKIEDLAQPSLSSTKPTIAYVFTGQGAQWATMGQELLVYKAFRRSIEASEAILKSFGCRWSIQDEVSKVEQMSDINNPDLSQPICTALQIALFDLLSSWKMTPRAVAGHSSGEIAAAYAVGAISRDAALKVSYYRGVVSALAKRLCVEPAGMMAVGASESTVKEYIQSSRHGGDMSERLFVACINSQKNVTVSGPVKDLQMLQKDFEEENVFARVVKTGVPYHSPYMESVSLTYKTLIQDLQSGRSPESSIVMISSLTGKMIDPEELRRPDYWVNNLISAVKFSEAFTKIIQGTTNKPSARKLRAPVKTVQALGIDVVVEIGPHSALKSAINDVLRANQLHRKVVSFSVMQRKTSAIETLLRCTGELIIRGADADLLRINNLDEHEESLESLTNLPSYPFNHSHKFWAEARVSKEFRFRKHGYHELLGQPARDFSPFEPRWRHRISLDEHPWVKDHHVMGVDVYPAAGLIVMALEAARQMADETRNLTSFLFKDVVIGQALVVPSDNDGIEVQLYLTLIENGKQITWYGFRICAYSRDKWYECCRGRVGLEYQPELHEVERISATQERFEKCKKHLAEFFERTSHGIDSADFYTKLESIGIVYGPVFQGLEDVYSDNKSAAVAQVSVLRWADTNDQPNIQPHIIHPATLDNIFQAYFAAVGRDSQASFEGMVPTKITDLRISSMPTSTSKSGRLQVHASTSRVGFRKAEADLFAISPEENYLVVEGHLEATALSDASLLHQHHYMSSTCYNIEWKTDLSVTIHQDFADLCKTPAAKDGLADFERDIDTTLEVIQQSIFHTSKSLDQLPAFEGERAYLSKFADYIRRKVSSLPPGFRPCPDIDKYLEQVLTTPSKNCAEVQLSVRIARHLHSILKGDQLPLAVLFSDDLTMQAYAEVTGRPPLYHGFKTYIEHTAHKTPALKILEIGAGTGGTTQQLLSILVQDSNVTGLGSKVSRYVFTDVSKGFFEAARQRFATYSHIMDFKLLDIEKSPQEQGFASEDFDIIVAANALHVTSNMSESLQRIHWLLKPGGKLILHEITIPDSLRFSFIFGLLPGWWLATEKERGYGPLLTEDLWSQMLTNNGFSGLDVCVRDNDSPRYRGVSLLVSSKKNILHLPPSPARQDVVVVKSGGSDLQSRIAERLKSSAITGSGCTVTFVNCEDAEWLWPEQAFCIFLPELETSFLKDMSKDDLSKLQKLLSNTRSILWVSDSTDPCLSSLAVGLSRSYRSEHTSYKFINLLLETENGVESATRKIETILNKAFHQIDGEVEDEYREVDGLLNVGRVFPVDKYNVGIPQSLSSSHVREMPFRDGSEREITLSIATPGLLESFQFIDHQILSQPPGDLEVDIEIHATGLNFRDVLVAVGQVHENFFGLEGAGIIKRVGRAVKDLVIGDKVTCLLQGGFATTTRCLASLAVKVPEDMPYTVGASIPIVYATAYHALVNLARLTTDESILVHSGAGGLGQAAIQIARWLGATVYVTVGSKAKKDFLQSRYGIPEERILSSRRLSFAPAIHRLTNGVGVDVVLNSLDGEALRESWKCIAPFGRFVETGLKDIQGSGQLPMDMFAKNVSFSAVDLVHIMRARPLLAGKLLREVMDLIKDGHLSPSHDLTLFPGSQIEKAVRLLQSGQNVGKIVVQFLDSDLVPTLSRKLPSYDFNSDASYVIAGGLGGLGRSTALWMATKGARHIILLSRRASHEGKAEETLRLLQAQGVNVATPRCDVTDPESLASAIQECSHMPPIKGCIQGAMVLDDMPFNEASLDVVNRPLKPKVHGSNNLHTLLPKNLDFFVMLSSISGVAGTPGQAAYGMGNLYQDSLARYRASQGQKAISLNLGVVSDVGYVAESKLGNQFSRIGYTSISAKNVMDLLDHYCNPYLPVQPPKGCQLIVGLESLAQCRARGGDGGSYYDRPLFSFLGPASLLENSSSSANGGGSGSGSGFDFNAALKTTTTLPEAEEVICRGLEAKLSAILGIEKNAIDTGKPAHTYGIDSLVAIEVRNWFRKAVGADMAVFEIMSNNSIADLALAAAGKSSLLKVA